MLDVTISVLWITLFGIRLHVLVDEIPFEDGQSPHLIQAYLFIFGVQIILLTLRGLQIFSNSEYLGTLLKIGRLMLMEIAKFFGIFAALVIGFVFGIWLISAANECENGDCDDYEITDLPKTIIYIFQVFSEYFVST